MENIHEENLSILNGNIEYVNHFHDYFRLPVDQHKQNAHRLLRMPQMRPTFIKASTGRG